MTKSFCDQVAEAYRRLAGIHRRAGNLDAAAECKKYERQWKERGKKGIKPLLEANP